MMYGLPEISGGHMKLLAKTAGKRRGIVEAAGEGDLGDGVAGGAEHLNGHAEAGDGAGTVWARASFSMKIR